MPVCLSSSPAQSFYSIRQLRTEAQRSEATGWVFLLCENRRTEVVLFLGLGCARVFSSISLGQFPPSIDFSFFFSSDSTSPFSLILKSPSYPLPTNPSFPSNLTSPSQPNQPKHSLIHSHHPQLDYPCCYRRHPRLTPTNSSSLTASTQKKHVPRSRKADPAGYQTRARRPRTPRHGQPERTARFREDGGDQEGGECSLRSVTESYSTSLPFVASPANLYHLHPTIFHIISFLFSSSYSPSSPLSDSLTHFI